MLGAEAGHMKPLRGAGVAAAATTVARAAVTEASLNCMLSEVLTRKS